MRKIATDTGVTINTQTNIQFSKIYFRIVGTEKTCEEAMQNIYESIAFFSIEDLKQRKLLKDLRIKVKESVINKALKSGSVQLNPIIPTPVSRTKRKIVSYEDVPYSLPSRLNHKPCFGEVTEENLSYRNPTNRHRLQVDSSLVH